MSFVASTRIDVATLEPLASWTRLYPSLRFKLDPTEEWDDALAARVGGLAGVDVVDLKGQYRGTPVDSAPTERLYRLAAEAFPEAWIEDPNLETTPRRQPRSSRTATGSPGTLRSTRSRTSTPSRSRRGR